MKEKLKRDWYGREKSTQELHDDSRDWLSEIGFVDDEMRFLDHVLGSNYIDFLENNQEKDAKKLSDKIEDEKQIGSELQMLIHNHEKTLGDLIATNSVTSNTHFIDIHKKLEFEMQIFFKKYKKLKRQIFEIVENIMRKKDQKMLTKHT